MKVYLFKILLYVMVILLLSFGQIFTAQPKKSEKLSKEQVFTYRLLDEPPSFDPQITEDVDGSAIARDLFEGLLNQDANGNLVPGVAHSWKASKNNTVFTFKLRKNAKWSNGKKVTANDFVYAWRRATDPDTASPYQWFMGLMNLKNAKEIIEGKISPANLGVRATDDYTLVAELEAPKAYFPQMLTHTTTFPTPKTTVEKYGKDWTKPGNIVGNGAYVLTEYKINERSVRERNPYYWDNKNTIIDKVVAVVVNDENIAYTRYLAGELDKTDVPVGKFKQIKKQYPNQALAFPRLCNYYYTFNLSPSGPKFFKDVRVRKALSYALDRNIIVENILQGGQEAAYHFTPSKTAGYDAPTINYKKKTQKQRDREAVKLLREAGYDKNNPLSFTMIYNTSEAHKQIAIAMSQMWKQKLGVRITLENMEWKTFLEERGNQNFELARGAWCGDYNEASTFLDLLDTKSGYNDGKFSNPKVDALLAKSSTAKNPAVNYKKIEEILAEQMPVIPIYFYTGNILIKENLKGWPVNNIEGNWYSKDLYKIVE